MCIPVPRTPPWRLLLAVAVLLPLSAAALISVGRGSDPVHDPGWPEGALAVANLESRVGWWEGPPYGGGEWQFLYRGDTVAFGQALAAFAAIRAPVLELVVRDGPFQSQFLQNPGEPATTARVDWTFTVWHPASWHRLFNDPRSVFGAEHPNFRQPVAAPRLDVHVGGDGIDWAKVTVPPHVLVRDERAAVGGVGVCAEVYDMATGKPVRGARFIAARLSSDDAAAQAPDATVGEAVSDDSGRVRLERVPAGPLRLSVAAAGYATRALGQDRYGERTVGTLHVELATAAAVNGVVMDTDGRPVAGAQVRATNGMAIDGRGYSTPDAAETVTDAAGHFELTGLATGYTQLRVRAPGYSFWDPTIHGVPPRQALVVRLARAGQIVVAVVDGKGQAMAKLGENPVLVEVEAKGGPRIGSWGGSAQIGGDGTHEFRDVPPGEYRVSSRPNPATTGKTYVADQFVRVEPGGRVSVTVVYE